MLNNVRKVNFAWYSKSNKANTTDVPERSEKHFSTTDSDTFPAAALFCFLPQSLHLHLKYLKYLLNIYKGLEEFYVTYICTVYICIYIYTCLCVCYVLFFFLVVTLFIILLKSSNHDGNVIKLKPQHRPGHCYFTTGFFFFEHLCKYSPSRRYCNVTKIKIIISMQAGFPPNDSSHTFSPEWLTVFTSVKKAADSWLINVNSNCPRGRAEIRPI